MHFLTLLMRLFFVWMIVGLISCRGSKTILVPERKSELGGTAFYQKAFGMQWAQRDSFFWNAMGSKGFLCIARSFCR